MKFRFILPSHLPILIFAFMPLIYLSIHIGVQNQNVYKLNKIIAEQHFMRNQYQCCICYYCMGCY